MNVTENQHLTRQFDIIPMEALSMPIHVIGCGAIGSFVALNLAKMGLEGITCWDMDDVSVENMSNQFFRFKDIGTNKAKALASLIEDFTGLKVQHHAQAFECTPEQTQSLSGIVISAVDSMEVRSNIFEAIKVAGFNVKYIIDPRMSAEFYAQYTMNPFDTKDQATYEKTLYTSEEAVQERCTAKSTIYTATLAAGLIAKTVKDIITKNPYPRNVQWDIGVPGNGLMAYPSDAKPKEPEQSRDVEVRVEDGWVNELFPATTPSREHLYGLGAPSVGAPMSVRLDEDWLAQAYERLGRGRR